MYTYCKRDSLYFCRQLGDGWSVKPEVIDNLEQFTCAMYGHTKEISVNAVRTIILKQMIGDDEQRWSPRGRPWPRGHILKSLVLASKVKSLASSPRKLACSLLENSTIF